MRLIFMGTPESAVPSLARCVADGHEVVAVWTQPDRPAGRGNKIKTPPVKDFARAHGIPVHQPAKIRTDESFSLFTSHDVDAVIVVAYGRILPAAYLRAPRHGCVNVHFSLLPKYRGAAPVNWAIARGERVTGVTTMLMDEGLDTGPMLLQRETEISARETAPQLLERLAHIGAELLSETLARLGEIEARPQPEAGATLAPILKRDDGLIDWSSDAQEIARRVRGFQPWPNAYTFFKAQRLVVWQAVPLADGADAISRREVEAGVIVEAQGDALIVGCGHETFLKLEGVQPEGKQRMSARDFVNGMRVVAGERLGSADG